MRFKCTVYTPYELYVEKSCAGEGRLWFGFDRPMAEVRRGVHLDPEQLVELRNRIDAFLGNDMTLKWSGSI